ncbi:hypothetical protein LEP1GSC039_0667 [Leptospira santarosai str. 2000027870]|nr:hypothetical protein LEP1GSC039_0667 [Leptospira santarosai str. 2000027870]
MECSFDCNSSGRIISEFLMDPDFDRFQVVRKINAWQARSS